MISRQHRFHGYSSLNYVYRRGATVRDYHLSVRYIKNSRRSAYRAAVIVSRKVNKSAVVRNRIRRRLYEIIRSLDAKITEPYDVVLTVFSDQVAELPAEKLERIMLQLCTKAGIIGENNQTDTLGHGIVTRKTG